MKKDSSYYLIASLAFILFFFAGCKKDPSLPALSTHAATEITSSTAKSGGNITDDGGDVISTRGVVWNTNINPSLENNTGSVSSGEGSGNFTSNLSGLTPNTVYYVRAYATNSAGTAYGNQVQFATNADIATVTTADVFNIRDNSVSGGGNVIDDGGGNIISRGVVWSESENPTVENNYGMTGDGSGIGEFASVITGLAEGTLYYMRAYAINSAGTAYGNQVEFRTLNAFCGIVTFIYRGEEVTLGTVEGQNGTCWLDRNLGASRVATAYNDDEAYGDLFQWGRMNDGHQFRTSGTTSTLSNSDNPGHSNFIVTTEPPYDWRDPKNDNLWQGNGGINVCPVGWRAPTSVELENELLSWISEDYTGAFESPLKITAGGNRGYYDGTFYTVGMRGFYWTTTVAGTHARYLRIESWKAEMAQMARANGASVRCIKDE